VPRLARIFTLASAALLTACGTAGLEPAGTRQGERIGALWVVFFWAAVGVAAVVYGLILWSVARYRRRPDRRAPPQFRSQIPIEIAYTLIPIAIVAVLFVLTFRTERQVLTLDTRPAATIRVQAFDWSWRFDYEGTEVSVIGTPDDPPEMVVPVDEPVRIELTATDVIHSFYVRDFLFKRDAIPGIPNTFDLTVDEPGTYAGQCAEFCGLDHYRMRFSIRAVPAEEFEAWLAEGGGP
jgi:cytochrome c oxidase subunit 2